MTDDEFNAIKSRDDAFCRVTPRSVQLQAEKDCTDLVREVERLRSFVHAARRIVGADCADEVFEEIERLGYLLDSYDGKEE